MEKKQSGPELQRLAAETITKMRGKLNAAIDLLREQGVADAIIAERVVKAARAEYPNDYAAVLEAVWKAEASESGDPMQKALLRGGDAKGAILSSNPGSAKLTAGAGTWAPVKTNEPTRKSRSERDDDAQAEIVAKRRKKIANDIRNGGLGGSR